MATESSSVLVAVRVRPFTAKEDTACCTITVPDSTTISVLDLPALIPSSTSGGPAAGNAGGGGGWNTGSDASGAGGGSAGTVAKSLSFAGPSGLESLQHAYSFDKIFWSVAPSVLPFPPLPVLEALAADADGVGGAAAGGGGRAVKVPGLAHPTKAQLALLSQHSAVAKSLPCFANAPTYDDQQRVYGYIGPRMHEAVMAGFNACLFAYGQTGSGKSYSMIGPTEALSAAASITHGSRAGPSAPPTRRGSVAAVVAAEQGIMPRLCADLFRLMREEREKDEGVTYSVELSFLEIYCEKVRDLLAITASSSSGAASTAGAAAGAPTAAAAAVNSNYFNSSAAAGGSLRIRQHPSQGPYVEGLSHVKVRDADGVLKYLLSGMRDRATAETNMNEHSSRSHAILQLHITKVMTDTDDSTGAVVTRTRTCKVNMVDLAGSERVSQSGVSGDRFEEAKNINLSLSTLGRVIQQLSEKQAGKYVIPAYRDSVLTWLLSDSLGGNSKTIMLATVAPSAYCYQQTLNTLRFAGVAKKVVNVASVNEDRRFQELITELRRQIVRLTLQLESGKAAEVHLEKINALKREREALLTENDALKVKVISAADTTVLQALRKRVKDLEEENSLLREEKQAQQERMLTTTGSLRDELAQQRSEVMQLHETLAKRESELAEWANKYRALVISSTTTTSNANANAAATSSAGGAGTGGGAGFSAAAVRAAAASGTAPGNAAADAREAHRALVKAQEELKQTKSKLHKATQEGAALQRAAQEANDAAKSATSQLDEYRVRYEESQRQLDGLHERMQSTVSLLETTQCELAAVKSQRTSASAVSRAVEDALEATSTANATAAAQLEQTRTGYLEEKQRNVQLLLRVAQVEQERSALKRAVAERVADTSELEQLLLEEAETSERYYMRMRFHRYAYELHHQWTVQLVHLRSMEEHHRRSRASASYFVSTGAFTPRPGEEGEGAGEESLEGGRHPHGDADGAATHRDPTSRTRSTATSAFTHDAAANARLDFLQRVLECQCEEVQARASVEQDCAADMARLLSQKLRLRQLATAGVSERLAEVEDAERALREELHFFKQKLKSQEEAYAEEVAQHQSDSAALQIAEMERLRLERKVGALEDVVAELEGGRNSLIAKVAQLQEEQRTWQARCGEAERIATEVQDLLFPGSSAASLSSPLSRNVDGDTEAEEQHPGHPQQRRRSYAALQLEAATLANKVREAEDALAARAALEQRCEEYQVELGAVRAQVAEMRAEKQAAEQQLTRSDQAQQVVESRLSEANAQLVQEMGTMTRDYESRIKQQQTMMNTLRHALEEETSMADLCRQSAQRAEAARQAQEEDLLAARETIEELRRQRDTTSNKYVEVQTELDELRSHYHALERRLMELREAEPELYVLLEKGLDEDTTAWLDKVRGEKRRLQRQRYEAQRLNSELLEHVRDHSTRLRFVQQQLTDVSFGEDEAVERQDETADTPVKSTADPLALVQRRRMLEHEAPETSTGRPELPQPLSAAERPEPDEEELGCTVRNSTHARRR